MSLQFFVLCRKNDPDNLYWGKEGPRLYQTERNALKQANRHNANDAKWGKQYEDTPHLQTYKLHGEWIIRKVEF